MRIGTDEQRIRADWAARGYTCGRFEDPPGQRWEAFRHVVDEVVVVLQGEMEFEVDGQVLRPAPGEEVLIPARVIHSARNVGRTVARWLHGYRGA